MSASQLMYRRAAEEQRAAAFHRARTLRRFLLALAAHMTKERLRQWDHQELAQKHSHRSATVMLKLIHWHRGCLFVLVVFAFKSLWNFSHQWNKKAKCTARTSFTLSFFLKSFSSMFSLNNLHSCPNSRVSGCLSTFLSSSQSLPVTPCGNSFIVVNFQGNQFLISHLVCCALSLCLPWL